MSERDTMEKALTDTIAGTPAWRSPLEKVSSEDCLRQLRLLADGLPAGVSPGPSDRPALVCRAAATSRCVRPMLELCSVLERSPGLRRAVFDWCSDELALLHLEAWHAAARLLDTSINAGALRAMNQRIAEKACDALWPRLFFLNETHQR